MIKEEIETALKGRLNLSSSGWIVPCLEIWSLFIMASLGLTVLAGMYAEQSGYQPKYHVIFRLAGFAAATLVIFIATTIRQYGLRGKYKIQEWVLVTYLVLVDVYASYMLVRVLLNRDFNSLDVGYCSVAYLLIYLWIIWTGNFFNITSDRIKTALALLLAIVALMFPILASKYLNSESYASGSELERMKRGIEEIVPSQPNVIKIEIDKDSQNIFKLNLAVAQQTAAWDVIGYFNMNESESEIRLSLDAQNLQVLCLMGDYSTPKNIGMYSNVSECLTTIFHHKDRTKIGVMKSVLQIPISSINLKTKIVDGLAKVNVYNLKTVKGSQFENQLRYMFARGAFFHHYNSIADGVGRGEGVETYFTNQYGFGPLVIVRAVAFATNLTVFDSIYVAMVVVNILIGAAVIGFASFIEGSRGRILLIGFAASIAITYSISNVMAPMLYFIRFLPTVLLFFLIMFSVEKSAPIREVKWIKYSYLFLLLITIFFNFEYGVLISAAIFSSGIVLRNRFYILTGIIALALALITKAVFIPSGDFGANYAAYLSGFGLGELTPASFAFVLCSIVILLRVFRNWMDGQFSSEIIVLGSIFFVLCIKVAWMGSANHIGPLFLLLGIITALAIKVDSSAGTIRSRTSYEFYSFVMLCILSSSLLISLNGYPHNNKIRSEGYGYTKISSIFKVSNELREKIDDFVGLYKRGDLVLSPIDNALSLAVSDRITTPYPDVSTNLNAPIDFQRIVREYVKPMNSRRIIVDILAVDNEARQRNYDRAALLPKALIYGLNSYDRELLDMAAVAKKIIDVGFFQCEKSVHFVVYCAPK